MDVSISEIKQHALLSLKGKWGVGVLLTIILITIHSALQIITESFFGGGFSLKQDSLSYSTSLINYFMSLAFIPITIAAYWFYLSLVRYEEPQLSQVFSIFADGLMYFKLIALAFVISIFTFLWALLFLIPGIIKSLSYSQAYFLIRDHPELTVLDAITESRKRMDGYKWKYFLMNLSFIGWAILCIFTFGIGFLWLSPYITSSYATFYNELIAKKDDEEVIV